MVLENLQPKTVWNIFENIMLSTYRESKNEQLIREKILDWVKKKINESGIDISIQEDSAGNILLKKKSSIGCENYPHLLLQAHMDMVCESNRDGGFDFKTSKIPVRIDPNGEWVDSDGTTLGADDGIGVSLILAIIFDKNIKHGPLEVLLTVDEETGLTGAFELDIKKLGINSNLLINVDSEDLGMITIGSAGGGHVTLHRKIEFIEKENEEFLDFMELKCNGLLGGHSGVDIRLNRANANKLIAHMLKQLDNICESGIKLCSWNGGTKGNAITRESVVEFCYSNKNQQIIENELGKLKEEILNHYKKSGIEPNMNIKWGFIDYKPYISIKDSKEIIDTAFQLPHGVFKFSEDIPNLVETSSNFAIIKMNMDRISFTLSCRSNIDEELQTFCNKQAKLGRNFGWETKLSSGYPGWKPEPENTFLKYIKENYEKVLKSDVRVEAIHAGLETGIIGAKIKGIKMVSIGPTIKYPHTPDEKLNIKDVGIFFDVLVRIIENLGDYHGD